VAIRQIALVEQKQMDRLAQLGEVRALKNIQDRLGNHDNVHESPDLVDTRIKDKFTVISPRLLVETLPTPDESRATTRLAREAIGKILVGESDKLLVITGPCSIHNADEALEYADQVALWRKQYRDDLEIIMRSYFEKPRTEKGWKGLI